ncbi:cystatin-like [Alosa pseudoharengus]|uniref:cystatin-like n=1 Tax=Alosa pseudoharengus TaxID=34774 RepID=UPI003F88C6CB
MFWTTAALVVILAFARVSTYPLVGGIMHTDPNIPQVKDALKFAVDEFNKQNVVYNSEVVKVITATSQVVEGAVYRFEVEMAISGCKPCAQQKCADVNVELTKPYTCYFEVWNAPWLEQPKLMKNDCNIKLP